MRNNLLKICDHQTENYTIIVRRAFLNQNIVNIFYYAFLKVKNGELEDSC